MFGKCDAQIKTKLFIIKGEQSLLSVETDPSYKTSPTAPTSYVDQPYRRAWDLALGVRLGWGIV